MNKAVWQTLIIVLIVVILTYGFIRVVEPKITERSYFKNATNLVYIWDGHFRLERPFNTNILTYVNLSVNASLYDKVDCLDKNDDYTHCFVLVEKSEVDK
jgi:hypothetical protein